MSVGFRTGRQFSVVENCESEIVVGSEPAGAESLDNLPFCEVEPGKDTTLGNCPPTWHWRQSVSREVFENKYNLHGDAGVEEVFLGVAKEIASVERADRRNQIEKMFFDALMKGKLIPAGRILANARLDSPMKNYNNCFTIDVEDSMESIYDSLKEDATISKMGGGVGFDVSKLRPKGDPLSGGGTSSGVISFLQIFDQSAKTIVTGGQRRSAHIALLDISHPDVEEFIKIKRGDENKQLTQFNISVKISDDFMKAVDRDLDWNLVFGGKIYKTLKARELYDLLARNAFTHNEPGIFNTDAVERYNNGYWAFKMDRVNPCGELVMPPYSLCCLSAINLTKFVVDPFGDAPTFDWEDFRKTVGVSVRFLDNVLDATDYPLEKIRTFSKQWRRIGLGFTGLGNLLCMLKIPYGSPESLEWCDKFGRSLRDASYSASVELAAEKGPFPAFDREKFLGAKFVSELPEEIKEGIARHGIRNIQMNTVAPTGTTSLSMGQNCSSGIEPIFALQYDRTIRTGVDDETIKETVYDYALLVYRDMFGEDAEIPSYFVTTQDIDPRSSIELQAILQKYIDHSISKTLNLPVGTTFDEYKDLYRYAYNKGLKGFTTFNPQGSMKGILEYGTKEVVQRHYAPERPKDLYCDIHQLPHNGKNYVIIVGILAGTLYELFALDDPERKLKLGSHDSGIVRKVATGRYDLIYKNGNEETLLIDFTKTFNSPDASLARFISMALRHGTPLQFIVDQLGKDTNFTDFERGVSRVLKNYIRDGEEVITRKNLCDECGGKLVFRDGCATCAECGASQCS